MEQKKKIIDIGKLSRLIWKRKKLVLIWEVIAFVLACVWILPEPRYYSCDVELAPETTGDIDAGGLSSIASSFGFNLGGMTQADAIYPVLYPDLFESPEFVVSFFNIQVQTLDGSVKTDYYTYLTKHQKKNPLKEPFINFIKSVKEWISPKKESDKISGDASKLDPFRLSADDYLLLETVKGNIKCVVDKKTDVTTIMVKDQDPLVCALLADSIKVRLQNFITEYRTSKARLDLDYYQNLVNEARDEYEKALKAYSIYADTHKDAILQSYISERDKLENDMNLKFNAYNAMTAQLEAAKAKVQERTPSFTTLKSATVPVKPAGPKRMIFVFSMMCFTFIGVFLYICRGQIVNSAPQETENT